MHLAALGPDAIRVAGELADGWYPFLLPLSGLPTGIELLDAGARRAGRPVPLITPGLPAAVAADPGDRAHGRLLVGRLLPDQHGPAVPADPASARPRRRGRRGPRGEPDPADDGGAGDRRAAARRAHRLGRRRDRPVLDRWYAAGAELPVVVLPPGRSSELEYMLESLARPSARELGRPRAAAARRSTWSLKI